MSLFSVSYRFGVFSLCLAVTACGQAITDNQTIEAVPVKTEASCETGTNFAIAVHGGAGVILQENLSPELETEYRTALTRALSQGGSILEQGGSALDAVEVIVVSLENDPKFNAGKGAVFSAAGVNELDASIMDGRDRNSGAIAGVTNVKNPIRLARKVMDESRHVMMQGKGAEAFAAAKELEIVDPKYFHTDRRWKQLQKKMRRKEGWNIPQVKYGTVGAVVLDNCGNLAAGTSTGGLTAKEFGRVGDTPIIGAGTYADNRYCAVSSTGTGEYFIRATIARDVCARREFLDETILQAADHMVHKTLAGMGGDGGIIAMDRDGNHAFSFNTPGMYRGVNRGGKITTAIFAKEE